MIHRSTVMLVCLLLLSVETAAAERYSIKTPEANIRSGPGTQYEWMWQVGKYFPIEVVQKKGNWYLFRDFEGDEGWIHNSLLDKAPTVVTVKEKCNVRSGPGTDDPILFSVGLGIPFKVLERKGNWIRVEHADGDQGWIHQSLVW